MPNVTVLLDARTVPEARVALVHPARGVEHTYASLRAGANRVGAGLLGLGVRKGDRVCIYLDSSAEYLISYLACWRIGAVAVPTNIVYRERELLHAVDDAGAVAVITDANGIEVVRTVRHAVPTLAHVVVVGGAGPEETPWESFEEPPAGMRPAHCGFDDLCQIQYTAGTTGKPKGAMLTHGNWTAALDAEVEALALGPADVYLGIYPMGHVGVSWGLAVLRAGGTWVVMDRYDLDSYLALARQYRPTVLAGMPPVIHALVNAGPEADDALASARTIISGGGSLLPTVWEAFDRRYGIPVSNAYGLSETIVCGSGTVTLPAHPELHRGYRSVGVPVGYTEVRIVDADDADREPPCRRGRRDRAPRAVRRAGLLEGAGRNGRGLPRRRLVPHRGHRPPRPGRRPLCHGSQEGHDHHVGLEDLSHRGRGRPDRPRGDRGRRGLRDPG